MILMDRTDNRGGIYNVSSGIESLPDEPVVPSWPADDETWNSFVQEPPGEEEIVNPPPVSLIIRFRTQLPDFFLPSRVGKIESL